VGVRDPGTESSIVAGRWELIEPIASGGTSTVWLARDLRRDVPCAAKLLRQREAGELLRFVREQSVRLHHPHVVAPYAWAADDGTVLIASDLVTGGSLHTLIGDHGPLDDPTVTVILDQLLDALGAVHAAGLVHRDVKPGNVLLRATGDGPLDIALVDFGLALSVDDARLTRTGTVVGTPGYLPPEVLSGLAVPAPGHDLYAAGRLAVALLLGVEGGADADGLALVTDPTLAETIRRLLASDPAQRPADATAAAALLAGATRSAAPRARDGEQVTVFEQISAPRRDTLLTPVDVAAGPAVPIPEHPPSPEPVPRVKRGLSRVVAVAGGVLLVGAAAVGLWALPGMTGSSPPTSPAAPSTQATPAATSPAPERACSWQQQGDRAETAGGVVVCTLVDGRYVWKAQ
jgi:serine/threonine-protein kinase